MRQEDEERAVIKGIGSLSFGRQRRSDRSNIATSTVSRHGVSMPRESVRAPFSPASDPPLTHLTSVTRFDVEARSEGHGPREIHNCRSNEEVGSQRGEEVINWPQGGDGAKE